MRSLTGLRRFATSPALGNLARLPSLSHALLLVCAMWVALPLRTVQADKVAAEALFSQGRQLMAEGNFDEACSKFEASQRLDPAVGTMLNLASCYEKAGRTASAWAQYRESSAAARAAGSSQREQFARERADALEPSLSRLRISTWKGQQVQVTRDGVPVDEAEIGTAMPIDPGEHEITAAAPGKRTWSTTVTIGKRSAMAHVTVPILPDDNDGAQAAGTGEPNRTARQPTTDQAPSLITPTRVGAIVSGALGLTGVIVGTAFGLQAKGTWDEAIAECDSNRSNCSEKGAKLSEDAGAQATMSTVSFALGAVGLTTGVVLWLLGGPEEQEQPPVAITPTGLWVNGKF